MKALIILGALVLSLFTGASEGYKVGDKAKDFTLMNIDDTKVSLSSYEDAKGYVVVFTCNHCPYAVAYEDRLIELHNEYGEQYPIVAINPNDPIQYPSDSFEEMKTRADEKGFPFAYLMDETQKVAKRFGALKTPHVYLLDKELTVKYIGAIDNNWQDPEAVTERYLEQAIVALGKGEDPAPAETKAIGCSVKWKK